MLIVSQCPYIADLMKLALGIGNCTLGVYNKILFGGHSSKSLHCSVCPFSQSPIASDQLPIKQPLLN